MNDYKSTLAALSIQRGTIFHSYDLFKETIDHGKFFAIMGENKHHYLGFFYVNSNICKSVQAKPALFDLQYPLLKRNYSFLTHNSFLGCNKLSSIEKTALAASIANGKTKITDQLTTEDLNNVLSMVRASKVFTAQEKKQYFY